MFITPNLQQSQTDFTQSKVDPQSERDFALQKSEMKLNYDQNNDVSVSDDLLVMSDFKIDDMID